MYQLINRVQEFSGFHQKYLFSRFQIFSPGFVGLVPFYIGDKSSVILSSIYQAKTYRIGIQEAKKEMLLQNMIMDAIVKFILPISFVAYKLTGSFIDFMLALTTSHDGKTNDNAQLFGEFSYSNFSFSDATQMVDQIGSFSVVKMKNLLGHSGFDLLVLTAGLFLKYIRSQNGWKTLLLEYKSI